MPGDEHQGAREGRRKERWRNKVGHDETAETTTTMGDEEVKRERRRQQRWRGKHRPNVPDLMFINTYGEGESLPSGQGRGRTGPRGSRGQSRGSYNSSGSGSSDSSFQTEPQRGGFNDRGSGPRRNRGRRQPSMGNSSLSSSKASLNCDDQGCSDAESTDSYQSNSSYSTGSRDTNALIQRVLRTYGGSCLLVQLLRDKKSFTSSMTVNELMDFLGKEQNFLIFENKEGTAKALVQVYGMPGIKLCFKYPKGTCDKGSCRYVHICRSLVGGHCPRGHQCRFSHNLGDEHNTRALSRFNLDMFTTDEKLHLLRLSVLYVCSAHNTERGCVYSHSSDAICPAIHICKQMVQNNCQLTKEQCSFGHDVKDSLTKMKLLRMYKLEHLRENEVIDQIVVTAKEESVGKMKVLSKESVKDLTQWLLCQSNGLATIEELMLNCSLNWLSQYGVQELIQTLEKHDGFLVFQSEEKPKSSVVQLHERGLRICMSYVGKVPCSRSNCVYIHLCRDHIADICSRGDRCRYSHDIKDGHNLGVLSRSGMAGLTTDQAMQVLRLSVLMTCDGYNQGRSCEAAAGRGCRKLHVCSAYIRGRCELESCPHSHSLEEPNSNKRLLQMHGVGHMEQGTVRKLIIAGSQDTSPHDQGPSRFLYRRPNLTQKDRYNFTETAPEKPRQDRKKSYADFKKTLEKKAAKETYIASQKDATENKPKSRDYEDSSQSSSCDTYEEDTEYREPYDCASSHIPNNSEINTSDVCFTGNDPDLNLTFGIDEAINEILPGPQKFSVPNCDLDLTTPHAANPDLSNIPVKSCSSNSQIEDPTSKSDHLHQVDPEPIKPQSILPTTDTTICEASVRGACTNQKSCGLHHWPVPYLWQVCLGGTDWTSIDSLTEDPVNEDMERRYADPGNDNFFLVLESSAYDVDFTTMHCELGPVRRLSTPSYRCTEALIADDNEDRRYTKWLWYCQADSGDTLYGQGEEAPYQDVLEARYQEHKQGIIGNNYHFERASHFYKINFAKMTQKNMQTKTKRNIVRRPAFYSPTFGYIGTPSSLEPDQFKFIRSHLPCPSWSAMDTESPVHFECAPLRPCHPEHVQVSGEFNSTIGSSDQYAITKIYRVQNIGLWENFERKKRELERRLGTDFKERRLFHGTPDLDTVWCICSQGFDIRMHGRHATAYGMGAYFATTARYSDNYTDRQGQKKHMFVGIVLVGRYTRGNSSLKRPPPLGTAKHGELYDSVVDNVQSPSIYVIFETCQSYPSYLIEYERKRNVVDDSLYGATASHYTTFRNPPRSYQTSSLGSNTSSSGNPASHTTNASHASGTSYTSGASHTNSATYAGSSAYTASSSYTSSASHASSASHTSTASHSSPTGSSSSQPTSTPSSSHQSSQPKPSQNAKSGNGCSVM